MIGEEKNGEISEMMLEVEPLDKGGVWIMDLGHGNRNFITKPLFGNQKRHGLALCIEKRLLPGEVS